MKKQVYFKGTGRRKEAIAQVKLSPGEGAVIVDGTPYEERFPRLVHRAVITRPLTIANCMGKYNAIVKVTGGGVTGQSDAIAHGIARALIEADGELRGILKKNGLLTRDSRVKERKKAGLKRARKAAQYTKR